MAFGDTPHILQDVKLKRYEGEEEPRLYRFRNNVGDEISAIYLGDREVWRTYTKEKEDIGNPDEAKMIWDWNSREEKELELTESRLRHVRGVAEKMKKMVSENPEKFGAFFTPEDAYILGFLHDIGYAFTENGKNHEHAGGTVLKANDYRYANEIYYHGDPEQKFYDSLQLKLLQYCDMTVDSEGKEVSTEQRISDIAGRYGKDSAQAAGAKKMQKRLLAAGFKDDGSGVE